MYFQWDYSEPIGQCLEMVGHGGPCGTRLSQKAGEIMKPFDSLLGYFSSNVFMVSKCGHFSIVIDLIKHMQFRLNTVFSYVSQLGSTCQCIEI